ncbi:HNH endonuclease signature motif containing protein [Streptomyces sp. NPDC047024]|uniref:HNH endonuclease signature motif containing protein n=1 Tax=Streptomyces sp. NPDC047024 TaxID=3155476 RepID=UPI0033EFF498
MYGGRRYDSKAIVGAAHGYLPGCSPLVAKEFSGGAKHAVALLRELGFEVVGEGAVSDELLHRLTRMRANRSSGEPALYKPITLLWAMGRARRGEARLVGWAETEEALAGLLRRHGRQGQRDRPDYPVASLCRDGLWTLPEHAGDVPSAHGDTRVRRWFVERQPMGGLTQEVYDLFRDSEITRFAVRDQLVSTYFDGLDPAPLLAEVGLTAEPSDEGPESALSTAVEYEIGCRLIELAEERTHGKRASVTVNRPVRSPLARRVVLGRSGKRCENSLCTGQPDDLTDRGLPILEVDHVVDLALGGRDHPSQMVALCPNCHAVKTRGRSRERLRALLLEVAAERHRSMRTQA